MKWTIATAVIAFAAGIGLVAMIQRMVQPPYTPSSTWLAGGTTEDVRTTTTLDTARYQAIVPFDEVHPAAIEVELTGEKDQWHIQYDFKSKRGISNRQRLAASELRLPVNATVR